MPDRASGAVVAVGSLHYIMVDAPDRPRKGETMAGSAWKPKFGARAATRPSPPPAPAR